MNLLVNVFLSSITLLQLASCSSADDTPSTPPVVEEEFVTLPVGNSTPVSNDNRVIYELNLYDFTKEGTFDAATKRLESLKSLGVDIVWLMPVHQRGVTDKCGTLGSPYASKDYYSVNSDFGTIDNMKAFVDKAHSLGIRVWLDWVANHTSTDAVWTTEHPEYYTKSNGNFVHPNDYPDVYQLAMESETVQNAMIEAMRYWIMNADIDGFRCDYISSPHIPSSFWQRAIPALKQAKPGKEITFLGESDFTDVTRLYGCGFDYDYAWGFNSKLQKAASLSDVTTLKSDCMALVGDTRYQTSLDRMIYLTNHDLNAYSGTEFTLFKNNVYPLTVLSFTLYGMPLLYNGQEIGYNSQMSIFERAPIEWNSVNSKMNNTIRTLCALKHTQKALSNGESRGSVKFLTCDKSSILAYVRKSGNNEVLVILNMGGATTVKIDAVTPGNYISWIDSDNISKEIKGKKITISADSKFTLGNNGYKVFVLN